MPIVYNEDRRWNDGIGGFVFMGIAVGIILGLIYAIYDNNGRYMKLFLVQNSNCRISHTTSHRWCYRLTRRHVRLCMDQLPQHSLVC